MPALRYTKKKTPSIGSKAAAEVKRLLDKQEPPLGYADAAALIGVHAETMRSVVNDERTPSAGVINGLARALELSTREVNHLFALLTEDRTAAKLKKAADSVGEDNGERFADIYTNLTPEQRVLLMRSALKFANENTRKKGQK